MCFECAEKEYDKRLKKAFENVIGGTILDVINSKQPFLMTRENLNNPNIGTLKVLGKDGKEYILKPYEAPIMV